MKKLSMNFKTWWGILVVSALVLLLLPPSQTMVQAVPQDADFFYGTLSLDGILAPEGITVTARVRGFDCGSITTQAVGIYATAQHPLIVQSNEDITLRTSDTIYFYANGAQCKETTTFVAAGVTELNLTAFAPYTSGWNPAKSATGVPVNTNIVVHVRDDGAGVDQATIKMTVNGSQVTPTVTGAPADYIVTYDPPSDFGYGQVVNVTVDAKDLASPPNVMTTDSYSFTIGTDTIPPYTSRWNPAKGATGVPANTSIVVHVQDDQTGVNQSTIKMTVNSLQVTPTIAGTPADYTVTYTPSTQFGSGQVVYVTVDAKDLASPPNVMVTDSYSFTTMVDATPPYTSNWYPSNGDTGMPININITLRVKDIGSGVDISSIEMRAGTNLASLPIVNPAITGTTANYLLTYDPPSDFGYGQKVYVRVAAEDLAGNVMPIYSYSFTTEGSSTPTPTDTTAPYTSGWDPAKDATGVTVNTNIVVHVRDAGAGVDFSTIVMTVEGNQVAPTITGTPADYTVTYDPPTNFGYGQVVDVTVVAQDLASPPNVMATDSYSFTTIEQAALKPIKGLTYDVKGLVLPDATVKLIKDGVEKGTATRDPQGNYSITVPETGTYTVRASKTGFRDKEQKNVEIKTLGQEYTLNFKGEQGLIPNAPDIWYLLDCAAIWKYPPQEDSELCLDIWGLLDVAAAWKYPIH